MSTRLTAVRYHHGNNRLASQWLSITVTVFSSRWNVNNIDGCPLSPWQQQTCEPMTVNHSNGFLVMLKCQKHWRLSAITMATTDLRVLKLSRLRTVRPVVSIRWITRWSSTIFFLALSMMSSSTLLFVTNRYTLTCTRTLTCTSTYSRWMQTSRHFCSVLREYILHTCIIDQNNFYMQYTVSQENMSMIIFALFVLSTLYIMCLTHITPKTSVQYFLWQVT